MIEAFLLGLASVCLVGFAIDTIVRSFKRTKPAAKDEIVKNIGKAGLYNGVGVFLGWSPEELGKNKKRPPLYYSGDRHIITIAPTGSGKGVTSQIPALLNDGAPCSALVIDVKGQLAAVTGQSRFLLGHAVHAINPFDVLEIPTVTYNPLKHIEPESLSFSADCRKIAEGLIDLRKGDHWELSALDVVSLLIEWVVLEEEEKNLLTVQRLLNLPDEERIAFFTRMTGCPRPAMAQAAARYALEDTEVRNCIQTAVVQLGFLRDEGIARILRGGGDEISFADMKKRDMTVYLIIPPEFLQTHGRFLRLMVLSALSELFKERTIPKNPVLFMLDEFAQLGPMPLIENAAAICRDYKIRLWLILQNIPQLKDLYKNRWESFLSSSGVLQFFTPNDMETASYISHRAGTQKVKRKSESFSSGNGSSSESTSYSEVLEPLLTTEDILGGSANKQVLFCPGVGRPLIGVRAPYFLDDTYRKSWGLVKDPYHMTNEEREEFIALMKNQASFFSSLTASLYREVVAHSIIRHAAGEPLEDLGIVFETWACGVMARKSSFEEAQELRDRLKTDRKERYNQPLWLYPKDYRDSHPHMNAIAPEEKEK